MPAERYSSCSGKSDSCEEEAAAAMAREDTAWAMKAAYIWALATAGWLGETTAKEKAELMWLKQTLYKLQIKNVKKNK